ncbi:hypothetical protein [Carboxylicivirga marina]|uniref:hypothetical protein n=1 Tax=Carboxylicivirga marina TaxID=2800988 RepID=UPI002591A535|nr:hypothetical protein [uncultured Carboxylicivirga sp.]
MEVTKLNNLIWNLVSENTELNYPTLITNLINSISQNQPPQIENHLKKLQAVLLGSKINYISFSDTKILTEIEGNEYFGIEAFQRISDILNGTPFNNALTVQKLQEYNKKRTEFITQITQLKSNFEKLNIKAHYYEDDIYEVGLIMPEEVTGNTIVSINKNLHRWDQIFKTLKELTGGEIEDTKITLVNNGSLEYFFENAPQIALCISVTIERLATLYKRIIEIRAARLKLVELGAPKSEANTIEKHERSEIEKEIKEIVNQVVKEYSAKIETGRKNELKNALTSHVKYIAKSLDKGISVEITPPEISEPEILRTEATEENKQEKEKAKKIHKERLARIELTNKSTALVKEIVKTGNDVFKYLTNGDNGEDDNEE